MCRKVKAVHAAEDHDSWSGPLKRRAIVARRAGWSCVVLGGVELLGFHVSESFRTCINGLRPAHRCCMQDFFLTAKHRAQLKSKYGVESWHFEQHANEAVFIPAGCPHQVS